MFGVCHKTSRFQNAGTVRCIGVAKLSTLKRQVQVNRLMTADSSTHKIVENTATNRYFVDSFAPNVLLQGRRQSGGPVGFITWLAVAFYGKVIPKRKHGLKSSCKKAGNRVQSHEIEACYGCRLSSKEWVFGTAIVTSFAQRVSPERLAIVSISR